ncbi:MAG: hypothetical protein FWG07_01375 [Treponema sp.]|nr:hypothetical protein [Treponema sp.]
MKFFIITIDTEGDNLWDHRLGDTITTKNARFIPRFQELCDKYNFFPVYLVNYEMAQDSFFVDFAKKNLNRNTCEIGIHPHAWNNPPFYDLKKAGNTYGLPYLIEYPESIMKEKINVLFNLLKETFQCDIVSHRSGRWAANQVYYDLLINYGVKIDCSVTPHVSWKNAKGLTPNSKGSDYRKSPEKPFFIKHSIEDHSLLEIPVTIRMLRHFSVNFKKLFHPKYFASIIMETINGKPIWLRPNGNNASSMLALIHNIKESEADYLMFMLHSSELMPGGSPKFKTLESIENLYHQLDMLFNIASKDFHGITLRDYYSYFVQKKTA